MKCIACNAEFHCGIGDDSPCWCSRDFPPILTLPAMPAGCYCPACLKERVAAQLKSKSEAGQAKAP